MDIIKPIIEIQEFDRLTMRETIKELDTIIATFGPQQPIVLKIDSYGGEVAALSMIYSRLRTLENPVITYTSSVAMSCGMMLLTLNKPAEGPTRIASEGANIMVHDISSAAGGNVSDIGAKYKSMVKESEYWLGLVAKRIGLKSRKALLDKIYEISERGCDGYLTAKEALDLGMIDMIGDIQMTPFSGYDISVKPTDKEIKKIMKLNGVK